MLNPNISTISLLLFILAAKQFFSTKNYFGHFVAELAEEAMLLGSLKQSKDSDHNHPCCGMSYKLQIQWSQADILLVYLRNGKYNDHKRLYCWYILEMANTMITSGYVATPAILSLYLIKSKYNDHNQLCCWHILEMANKWSQATTLLVYLRNCK